MGPNPESKNIWFAGNHVIDCARPQIIAILNATPDSFFEGSRTATGNSEELRDLIAGLVADGADILDVGGQSTRPGSERVGAAEELRRVVPVIEAALDAAPGTPVSIDTYHGEVAREALSAGASIVNDISAGSLDPAQWDSVAESDCGYVLMHMQGTPETMQKQPNYSDALAEIGGFLESKLAELNARGVAPQRVVLDPGIGFGKRLRDNLALISGSEQLAKLGRPLLYGVSRKSFIGRIAGEASAEDPAAADAAQRLPATLAATYELLMQGVMLHRVHDVYETRQVMQLWNSLNGKSQQNQQHAT